MISGRRREGQTIDSFYHEFEITHVQLMKQAQCERFIKRYTQNKSLSINNSVEFLAKIDTQFDSQASLAFDDMKKIEDFFSDPEYIQIVKPHEFTDPNYMTFELCEENIIKSGEGDEPGVKVIYYFKPHSNLSRYEFRKVIEGPYTELLLIKKELLSLYLRSYCFPEEYTVFAQSVFPNARISHYGVIDELWFNSLEDMKLFHQNLKQTIQKKISDAIDLKNSFGLVVRDKVVFGNRP